MPLMEVSRVAMNLSGPNANGADSPVMMALACSALVPNTLPWANTPHSATPTPQPAAKSTGCFLIQRPARPGRPSVKMMRSRLNPPPANPHSAAIGMTHIHSEMAARAMSERPK